MYIHDHNVYTSIFVIDNIKYIHTRPEQWSFYSDFLPMIENQHRKYEEIPNRMIISQQRSYDNLYL